MGAIAQSVLPSGPEIDPHILHILSRIFPSYTDPSRASCQLLVKKWALNTGKLPSGGLPVWLSN